MVGKGGEGFCCIRERKRGGMAKRGTLPEKVQAVLRYHILREKAKLFNLQDLIFYWPLK